MTATGVGKSLITRLRSRRVRFTGCQPLMTDL